MRLQVDDARRVRRAGDGLPRLTVTARWARVGPAVGAHQDPAVGAPRLGAKVEAVHAVILRPCEETGRFLTRPNNAAKSFT